MYQLLERKQEFSMGKGS